MTENGLVAQTPGDGAPPPEVAQLRRWARIVLVPVGLIGAALSFASLYEAALPTYGPVLAAGFPFLVDFLILGASLQYIAGAKVGRPRAGWRITAHAGVVGTLVLNALASDNLGELPWHVVAPAVWSVLVEMTAREVLGEWKATHRAPADRIPLRLWLTAPLESVRTWLVMARLDVPSHQQARLNVGVLAAANEALRLALPGRQPRRVRRIVRRQLRAGSMQPTQALESLGWTTGGDTTARDQVQVLRGAIESILGVPVTPVPTATAPVPLPAAVRAAVEAPVSPAVLTTSAPVITTSAPELEHPAPADDPTIPTGSNTTPTQTLQRARTGRRRPSSATAAATAAVPTGAITTRVPTAPTPEPQHLAPVIAPVNAPTPAPEGETVEPGASPVRSGEGASPLALALSSATARPSQETVTDREDGPDVTDSPFYNLGFVVLEEHAKSAPAEAMTGPRLARMLGCSDGHARKIIRAWQATLPGSAPGVSQQSEQA